MEKNYEIGDIVDTIVDKNGKEWHVRKAGENVYEIVETMLAPYQPKPTMKPVVEWFDENLTEEQKKKWRFTTEIKPGNPQPIKEKPKESVIDVTDTLFAW